MQNSINIETVQCKSLVKNERKFRVKFPRISSDQRNHYENMVSRSSGMTLSNAQSKIMTRIIGQTVKYNKVGAFITLDWLSEQTSISIATVRKAIKYLSDIGMIFTYRNRRHRFIVVNMAFTDTKYQKDPKYKKTKTEWNTIHKRLGIAIYKNLHQVIQALREITPHWEKTMLRDTSRRKPVLRTRKKGNTSTASPKQSLDSLDDVIDNIPNQLSRTAEKIKAKTKAKPKAEKPDSIHGYATKESWATLTDFLAEKQEKFQQAYEKRKGEALDSIPRLKEKWEEGIKDRYGDDYAFKAWGKKQFGMAKHVRDNLRGLTPEQKQQFFYDAAYNWQEMTDKYFSWQVINIDDGPQISKLSYRVDALLNEFNSRDVIRQIERMPDKVVEPTMAEKIKTKEQINADNFEMMINDIQSLDRSSKEFSQLSIQQKKRLNNAFTAAVAPPPDHMAAERSLEPKVYSDAEKQANLERGIRLGVLNPDGTYIRKSKRLK